MVKWSEDSFITTADLVREMFSLLHRQYNGIGEVSSSTFIFCSIFMFKVFQTYLLKPLVTDFKRKLNRFRIKCCCFLNLEGMALNKAKQVAWMVSLFGT